MRPAHRSFSGRASDPGSVPSLIAPESSHWRELPRPWSQMTTETTLGPWKSESPRPRGDLEPQRRASPVSWTGSCPKRGLGRERESEREKERGEGKREREISSSQKEEEGEKGGRRKKQESLTRGHHPPLAERLPAPSLWKAQMFTALHMQDRSVGLSVIMSIASIIHSTPLTERLPTLILESSF
jgi:hypothetical protein